MSNKGKYLAKNVFLFSVSSFIPRVLSFFLIPIYTNCLTTEEYGVSDLLTTTVSLLIPIFTLDIQDAVMRFALDSNYKKEDVFSSAIKIILIGTGMVCLGGFVLFFLSGLDIDERYLFFFVVMYFTTALYNTISLFCRGIDKVNVMVVGGILQSIITLSANIIFLVIFEWGLIGYLFANTIGSVLALVWCFCAGKLYRYIKWKITKGVLKEMVSFSFPLIFSVIAWWINSASDRYILSWISGVAISGLYAISYKIPSILSIFQGIFTQAWSISAIKEFDKNDSDGFISNMYSMMNFSMVFICSIIMVLNIPIAKMLYSNTFFEAWKYVPPLLISVVFNAMALFIGSIFTAVKDTKTLSISTIVGAIINTIANFVLIYFCGAYGAALATMIGYAVVLIMRHIILRKHIMLDLKWHRDGIAYFLLIIQMMVSNFGINGIIIQIAICFIILMLHFEEIKSALIIVKNRL